MDSRLEETSSRAWIVVSALSSASTPCSACAAAAASFCAWAAAVFFALSSAAFFALSAARQSQLEVYCARKWKTRSDTKQAAASSSSSSMPFTGSTHPVPYSSSQPFKTAGTTTAPQTEFSVSHSPQFSTLFQKPGPTFVTRSSLAPCTLRPVQTCDQFKPSSQLTTHLSSHRHFKNLGQPL